MTGAVPQMREPYSLLLKKVFHAVCAFDGSRDGPMGYDALMSHFESMHAHEKSRDNPEPLENARRIFAKQNNLRPAEIGMDPFLTQAFNRYVNRSKNHVRSNNARFLESSGVLAISTDHSFLPSANKRNNGAQESKLAYVIEALLEIDIFTDDMLVYTSKEARNGVDNSVLISIPKLNCQVAIPHAQDAPISIGKKIHAPESWSLVKTPSKTVSIRSRNFEEEDGRLEKWKEDVQSKIPITSSLLSFDERNDNPALFKDALLLSAHLYVQEMRKPPLYISGPILFGPLKGILGWSHANKASKALLGKTLFKLLKENDVRLKIRLGDILLSIEEHSIAESWLPQKLSGIIKYGPLKGLMSWNDVDKALINQTDNLPKSSLSEIEETYFPLKCKDRGKNTNLFKEALISSSHCYVQENGCPPSETSGPIMVGPLKGIMGWDHASYVSKELFGMSLFHILKENDIRFRIKLENILSSIEAHRVAEGALPIKRGGMIEHGDLKGLMTWNAVDQALINQTDGLSKSSLRKVEEDYIRELCTIDNIVESAVLQEEEDKKIPTSQTRGTIQHGALRGLGCWGTIQKFTQELYGKKLSEIFKENGLQPPVNADNIINAISAFEQANDGAYPTRRAGLVEQGKLKYKTSWAGIDKALARGDIEGFEHIKSLSKFKLEI